MAIADVNGDGKPDLLIANECDSNINCPNGIIGVALSNGDGTFQPVVGYSSGGYEASSIAVGDVNGDGHPDLIVANWCAIGPSCSNGIVTVLLGNGDGTFQSAMGFNSGGSTPYSVAVADVNADGKLDVIVANTSGVGVLLGNGDGTFQTAVSYSSGDRSPDSVAIADVNGDGKPDLIVGNLYAGNGNYSRGSVDVLLGIGNGTFQAAVTLDSGGVYAYSVVAADVNGDGRPDLIVTNNCADSTCATGGVAVILGNRDGTFQLPVSYGTAGQNAESATVRDVNGDGKPDLVVVNQCSGGSCKDGAVAVLLGNGDGTFRPAISYDSGGRYGTSVAASDVNGDGKPDLLITSECDNGNACADGVVAVMLGNGDGSFQGAETFMPGGSWAYSVAIGDINRDGLPDLVVADQLTTGGSLSVLLGKGDGAFHKALNYPSGGPYAYSVAISDVNGDGKPDLVVANYTAGVGVLLGNGDGTFQPVNDL
jgi:hypothetical protein